MFNAAVGYAYD